MAAAPAINIEKSDPDRWSASGDWTLAQLRSIEDLLATLRGAARSLDASAIERLDTDGALMLLEAELIKGLLDSRRFTGGVARPGEIRAHGTLMSNIRHFELVDDGPGDRHIRLEVSAMLTRNRDARQVAADITELVQRMIGWTLSEAQAQKEKLDAVGVS